MAHDLHWFRCYPDAALNGSRGLTDAQFTTYWRLLFEMYARGGPVPYDEQRLKFLLQMRPQHVRRVVGQLVMLGKLSIEDGLIHNGRSDFELKRMNEKWRRNGEEMPAKLPYNDAQMDLHLAGHSAEKPNDFHARTHAPARDHAHPRQKIEDRKKGPALQAGALSSTPSQVTALPPREAREVASPAVGAPLPPEPAQAEPEKPASAMSAAELESFRSLHESLMQGLGSPIKRWDGAIPPSLIEASIHAQPAPAFQPDTAGDRPDPAGLPQPAGAVERQPGDDPPDAEQGQDRGDQPSPDESPFVKALRTGKPP